MKQMILYPCEMFKNLDLTTRATLHLDFETAFDKMCQKKLIENLRATGIASGAQTLLESYITEHYQNRHSKWAPGNLAYYRSQVEFL